MTTERREARYGAVEVAGFLSGVAALFLFLALARQHDVWFGRSQVTIRASVAFYALWVVVGCFAGWRLRARRPQAVAVYLAMALAALVPLVFPDLLVRSWEALLMAPAGIDSSQAMKGLVWRVAVRLAVPGAAAGWIVADQYANPTPAGWRRSAALLVGAVVGSALFSPIVAALGFEWLLRLTVLAAAGAAAFRAAASGSFRWRTVAALGLAGGLAVAAVACAAPARPLLSDGVFGCWAASGSGFAGGRVAHFHRDGARVSATVFNDRDYGRVLTVNGRPTAFKNRFKAGRMLSTHIPMLLAPRVRYIALFGEEAPLLLPSVRTYGPARLACRGTDEAVAQATRVFLDAGDTTAVETSHEVVGNAGYDVLQVAAGPAWTRHGRRALTEKAFRRYARVTAKDGVVSVAVDGRSLTPAAFHDTVAAFARVFASVHVWCTGLDLWVLVGSGTPLVVPVERMLERFERKAVFHDLLAAGVTALPEVLSACVLDDAGVRAYVARKPPRRGHAGARDALFVRENARQVLASVEPDRSMDCAWLADGDHAAIADPVRQRTVSMLAARGVVVTQLALSVSDTAVPPALKAAAAVNPRDLLLRELAERVELEAVRRLAFGDAAGALKRFGDLLLLHTGDPVLHYWMALANQRMGVRDAAYWHAARATALAPQTAAFRLQLASAALQVSEYDEAKRQFREALALEPDHLAAKVALARLLGDKNIPGADLQEAIRLAEEACTQTRWRDFETGYALADVYIEAGRVLEGVALKRQLKKALRTPEAR